MGADPLAGNAGWRPASPRRSAFPAASRALVTICSCGCLACDRGEAPLAGRSVSKIISEPGTALRGRSRISGLASRAGGPAAGTGLELLGQAGMVAIRAADLRPAAAPRLRKDGRTALTVARPGRIATGDLVVFLKPVAVAPAVVRRDGRVQAGGHPADHARLGLAEERLDELCGSPGVIDEIARTVLQDGKVKGAAPMPSRSPHTLAAPVTHPPRSPGLLPLTPQSRAPAACVNTRRGGFRNATPTTRAPRVVQSRAGQARLDGGGQGDERAAVPHDH